MALITVNSKRYIHTIICTLGIYLLSHNMSTHQDIYTIILCWKLTWNMVKYYTLVILIFLLGLYFGSESHSANHLSDFSAASCTEPLLVLSIWPSHIQAIPHEC